MILAGSKSSRPPRTNHGYSPRAEYSRTSTSSPPSSAPHDFSSLLPKSSFGLPRSSCVSGWLYLLATSPDFLRQYCRKLVFVVRKVQSRFLLVQLPVL